MSADVLARGLAASAARKLAGWVSVKDFGAKGDGTADDTAAIQAAIGATLGWNGGLLHFPKGIYRLTDELVVPPSAGWRMVGAGRYGTQLRQHTSNKAHIAVSGTGTWGFEIDGFTFTYAAQQTSANPLACAIRFGSGAGGETYFNWQVRNCHFDSGWRGIATRTYGSTTLWGLTIDQCTFGGTMQGAAIYITSSVGQPRMTISNCLFDMAGATEDFVHVNVGDCLQLLANEWLNGAVPKRPLFVTSVENVTMIGCRSENYNSAGGAGNALFAFSNCYVTAINTVITGVLGTGSVVGLFGNSGSSIAVHGLLAGTATAALLAFGAETVPFVSGVKLTGIAHDNMFGSFGYGPRFNADKRQPDRIADIGDVSTVLSANAARIQHQNAALSANRSITLPAAGLYEGMEFEIVRRAAVPGAFTLTVIDPVSGVNHTFASATNGFVKYRYQGYWRILASGTG